MATAIAVLLFGTAALGLIGMFRTVVRIGKPVDTVTTGSAAAFSVFFGIVYAVIFIAAGILLIQAH